MSPANTISIIGGQGFIGRSVAKTFLQKNNSKLIKISRNPPSLVGGSSSTVSAAVAADVTDKSSLLAACQGSSTIINLVGIMYESPPKYTFESVQAKGAANVAEVAKSIGANLVHVSAIGADSSSTIPYARTKGLGEEAVLDTYKERSVILRPSLVFGKDDDFFNRFARLANFLPFLPLFGGGHSKFQPVFVDDLASAIVQADAQMSTHHGKIFEIGGPNVYTYKQLMQLTLDQAGKQRLLLPLPWIVGEIQGLVLQQLPPNLFSLTRDQVWLLKQDNIVTPGALTLQDLGVIHPSSAESQLGYLKK